MKTRFWFAFVLFEFLPLRNKSLVSADASPSSGWLASVVLSFLPIPGPPSSCVIGSPFNDLAVVLEPRGYGSVPWFVVLFFTNRKTPTLPAATCTFSCLFPNHPVATSPLLLLLRLFVLKGWTHPLPVDGSLSAQRRSWGCGRPSGSKCRYVSFWTPRPSTRAHMVIFWYIPDAQPFSVSLSTAVFVCCVCVCASMVQTACS